MRHTSFDVAIVGAGLAGLTAARRLQRAGRTCAVFEARERVGGRIHGFAVGDRVIQLGGRWIGPGQDRIKALATELGLSVRPLDVFSEAFAPGKPAEFVRAVRLIDDLAATVPLDCPWTAPGAERLDAQTLDTWLRANFEAGLVAALTDVLIGFLPLPKDVSLLHALFYLRSNGGLAGIMGLDGPAHDSETFSEGAHALAQRLAEGLASATVRLNAPVREVRQDRAGVEIHVADEIVHAAAAIVTLPPVLAGRLHWDPPMPPDRDYLTQRMPIRGKIVAAVLYDAPFWRGRGFASDRIYAWDEGGDARPACITLLASIHRSQEVWAMAEPMRKDALLDDLAALLGPAAREPVGFHMTHWAAEPWSRGCNSFLTTGAWTGWGHALRAPVGRVYWAGAEISECFVGQMEGAVRSAEAAADAILESF